MFGFARLFPSETTQFFPSCILFTEWSSMISLDLLIWRFDLWILKAWERSARRFRRFRVPTRMFSFQNDKIIPPGDRPDRPGPSGPSPGGSSATYSPVGHLGQKWPLTVWKDHCLFQRKIVICFIQSIEKTLKHIWRSLNWNKNLKTSVEKEWEIHRFLHIFRWIVLLFSALKAFEGNSPLDLRWRLSRLSMSRQVMTSPDIAIVRDSEMRFHKCRGDAAEDS